MKDEPRAENLVRWDVLKLLSEDESAGASPVKTKTCLLDGEEYLDLECLDHGVLRATKTTTTMGGALPRRTVRKETWHKILSLLGKSIEP